MKPYLVMSIGTAGDGLQERRTWMIIDWCVGEVLTMYCEARNLKDFAPSSSPSTSPAPATSPSPATSSGSLDSN